MGKKKKIKESNQSKINKQELSSKSEKRSQLTASSLHFSGPLPPASEFERYNKALPGAADRILTMAEGERVDRNKNTRLEIKLYYTSRMVAQLLFAIICIGTIGSGVYLVILGENLTGLAAIITGLGVIASAFFLALKTQTKEN